MNGNCVFCKIAEGVLGSEIVYEDDRVVAFKDLNPQAPIHLLFIPRKHISSMNDISVADVDLLGHMFLKIKEVAGKLGLAADGYRTVVNCNKNAGQEVFHLHIHLLGGRPFRWPPG